MPNEWHSNWIVSRYSEAANRFLDPINKSHAHVDTNYILLDALLLAVAMSKGHDSQEVVTALLSAMHVAL